MANNQNLQASLYITILMTFVETKNAVKRLLLHPQGTLDLEYQDGVSK